MMFNQPLPFKEEGGKIILTGPCFLSCGCGEIIAKWASVAQNLRTRIPHGKPKSSKIIHRWIVQEKMGDKCPVLKQRIYGVVVAETENGFEFVNISLGASPRVAEQIGQLIRRHNEWKQKQSLNN